MDKKPKLEITPSLIMEAKKNKGGWVYQVIDPGGGLEYIEPHFIIGGWRVDDGGMLTGEFTPNPQFNAFLSNFYRPPSSVIEQAREHPNRWFYQIDDPYCYDAEVPQNRIYGCWFVDEAGDLNGEFQINPSYRQD